MSIDIKLFNTCDHKIIDYDMPITGTSPAYIGTLPIACDKNRNNIFIREYNTQENATTINNYLIGITNYSISSDGTQINFGTYPVDVGMRFPYVLEGLTPQNKYLIDFTCLLDECPRCLGKGYVYDMGINPYGKLIETTGSAKLKQEIIKILLTTLGNNDFDSLYGSALNNLIGEELSTYTSTLIQKYISDAMQYLTNKQTGLDLTDEERFLRIDQINVVQDVEDYTVINIQLIVLNYAFEQIPVVLYITAGGVS